MFSSKASPIFENRENFDEEYNEWGLDEDEWGLNE
jgi:hypothetical protein